MTITYKASSLAQASNGSSSNQAITLGTNPAVGDLVVICAGNFTSTNETDFAAGDCVLTGTGSFGTVTVDHVRDYDSGEGYNMVAVWSAVCTSAGTCIATITGQGSLYKLHVVGHVWEGDGNGFGDNRVDQNGGFVESASGTSTPACSSDTSTAAALIVGALQTVGSGDATPAAGTDYTLRGDQFRPEGSNETTFCTETRIVSSSTTDGADWTSVDNSNGLVAIQVMYQEEPDSGETASGAASITEVEAAGTATVVKVASGSPSITALTASGAANINNCDQLMPPDSITEQMHLAGAVTDIDEPVATPDGNWLTLSAP